MAEEAAKAGQTQTYTHTRTHVQPACKGKQQCGQNITSPLVPTQLPTILLAHLCCVELPHENAKGVDVTVLAQPLTPEALGGEPAHSLQARPTSELAQHTLHAVGAEAAQGNAAVDRAEGQVNVHQPGVNLAP